MAGLRSCLNQERRALHRTRLEARPSGRSSWIRHGEKSGGAFVGVFMGAGLADDRLVLDEDLHGEATMLAHEHALHFAPRPKDSDDQRFLQLEREVFTMLMDATCLTAAPTYRVVSAAWLHSDWSRDRIASDSRKGTSLAR